MKKSALTRSGLAALCFAGLWLSCGGSSVTGEVGAGGGEVCLPDNSVCIKVPLGGLATQEIVRISPGTDKPGGALSESYDISRARSGTLKFLKPATVTFSMDLVDQATIDALPSESLLRLYTRDENGEWAPLADAVVDRVKRTISGTTQHLSPFVVLRADRLPDGSMPIETDAGVKDGGGEIIVPPFDGGPRDSGMMMPDSGTPDSGTPDAGHMDAGTPDSGTPDAGTPDAGTPDAGFDAGVPDAGAPDAGTPDAGQDVDAGADAGAEYDAGEPDAGYPDAGSDAG